jgi:hypothetical protein
VPDFKISVEDLKKLRKGDWKVYAYIKKGKIVRAGFFVGDLRDLCEGEKLKGEELHIWYVGDPSWKEMEAHVDKVYKWYRQERPKECSCNDSYDDSRVYTNNERQLDTRIDCRTMPQ